MPPEDIQQWGFASMLWPRVMQFALPPVEHTCLQGSGTMDDYAILDAAAANISLELTLLRMLAGDLTSLCSLRLVIVQLTLWSED